MVDNVRKMPQSAIKCPLTSLAFEKRFKKFNPRSPKYADKVFGIIMPPTVLCINSKFSINK